MSDLAEKLDALLAKYYNGVHFDTIEPLAPLLAAVARDADMLIEWLDANGIVGWRGTAEHPLLASRAALAKEIG